MSARITEEEWKEIERKWREDSPDDVQDWPENEMNRRFYDPYWPDEGPKDTEKKAES